MGVEQIEEKKQYYVIFVCVYVQIINIASNYITTLIEGKRGLKLLPKLKC